MKESINQLKNEILEVLNDSINTEDAVNTILEMVGLYFNVDRAYIFENSKDDLRCSNTFEWCNKGIHPEKDNLQNLRYLEDLGGDWLDNYDSKGLFFCPTVSNLPAKQRDVLEPQGIFSMLQCAIKEQAVFKGYIGFDNCQDHLGGWEYDKDAIDALVFISRLTSLYLLEYRKKTELEQANRAKSNFLSRMSHELRTPLNAVFGYANLLDDNLLSNRMDLSTKKENIESIQRASKYLLQIVNDALDLQAIEHGQFSLNEYDVNLGDYMDTIANMIDLEAKAKNISFSYERLTHFSDGYHIDGVRLQQVFLNLLHNAVKFTPNNGTITMIGECTDHDKDYATLQFTITDTGIGMSEEYLKDNRLYASFSQENQDISSPYSGCGMGLTICKEIITLMNGEIFCESKKGKGTKFTFYIKAKPVIKKRRQRHTVSFSDYDLSGIRVLLCEDNPMNQDMEKKILLLMNCEVDIAEDGKVGYELFSNSKKGYYDIILMDIRMPNMDGLQATKAIRSIDNDYAQTVPIIAVSANAFEEDIQKSIASGMNEHLAKPIAAKTIHQKILQYCNVSK